MRLICFMLAALGLTADTLVLKNGREYEGVFESGTAARIHFKLGTGASRSFPTRDVERIQFGAKASASAPAPAAVPAAEPRPAVEPVAEPEARPAAAAAPPLPPLTVPELGNNSPEPLGGMGAIDSEYTARGSDAGILGTPRAASQATRDGRAVVRFYMKGAIYWTSGGGAHAVYGPILDAWVANGGESSKLGYPTSDEQDGNAGYSRSQNFERGTILWNQKDGAQIRMTGGAQ